MELTAQKAKLRAHYLNARSKMPPEYRQKLSDAVCQSLKKIVINEKAKSIHGFIPFGTEVDILPFLRFCFESNLTVVTPKIQKKPEMLHLITPNLDDLKKNKFGIKETNSSTVFEGHYDLILVPGVVYDQFGYRVGYGGGYYDYFLKQHANALKIGVGFPLQYIEHVPRENHDIAVDQLVLGARVFKIKSRNNLKN